MRMLIPKIMEKSTNEIKKEMEMRLAELRLRRNSIVKQFKKKIDNAKIRRIKDSLRG